MTHSIVIACAARGVEIMDRVEDPNDPELLRFCAHEASHALEVHAGDWRSEPLHRAVESYGPGLAMYGRAWLWRTEMIARAVEQVVCERVGVPVDVVEKRILVAHMEASTYRYRYPSYADSLATVRRFLVDSDEVQGLAQRIIDLAR